MYWCIRIRSPGASYPEPVNGWILITRWPGVLENGLILDEHHVRVVEDCLNGRRTVLEDPFKAGRNGLEGLAQAIEKHSPLALVIIMLGNNDLQSMHTHTAWHVAQGIASLIDEVKNRTH